ncbi:MAG: AMP-binding protein [Clostridia bacterium]|nr:AMP-binding protein [Clostridia bacterium]
MEKNKFRDVPIFNTVKELVLNSAKLYGDKTAFIIKEGGVKSRNYIKKSFKDLVYDVNCFGTALFSMGFAGKRVAVMGRNSYPWIVAYLANLFGDSVAVPLDKELGVTELEDSLVRSEAEALIYDSKYEDKINEIKTNGKSSIKLYISTEGGELDFASMLEKGRALMESGDTSFTSVNPDPDAMSILLFTSGTTDRAKAVMLRQSGIACNICDMQMVEDIRPSDTNIAFLPFHHIFGSVGMLVMVSCGVTTVFPDGLRYIKQNLAEYKVTLFVGVPVLIDGMKSTIEREVKKQGKQKLIAAARKVTRALRKVGIDLRKVVFKQITDALGGGMRFIISGGAPLDPATAVFFDDLGIDIVQGYGLTETSPVIAAENEKFKRLGSVGIPMRSLEVRIDNKDADGIGEIKVKGPTVMMGYYENKEATDAVLCDGWFNTGDLGYVDRDGFLFVTGRKKDMIVLKNGKKIFPEEVESLVNRIEGVSESFVYGYTEDGGISYDKILCKAVYEPAAFRGKSEEEIHGEIWAQIKEINKTLPMYKYIKGLTVTEVPLIKTNTNKVKRNEEIRTVK